MKILLAWGVTLLLSISLLVFPRLTNAQVQEIAVLPQPATITTIDGFFILRPDSLIVSDKANHKTGTLLAQWLRNATGYSVKVKLREDADNTISLKLDPALTRLGDEGYLLDVTPQRVIIRAPTEAGIFYGIQTLRQLFPPAIFASSAQKGVEWTIRAVHVEDQPRFRWRGAMLDVCRHFMPKEFVLSFVDLLALHKLNTFHWHLTDDQGWRIEIGKYPRLTEIGAWRKQTRLGHERNPRGFDKKPHGGFYTQQDIREVVEYARQRHITVVPEIEMPGHAQAAIAAYPWLGVTAEPLEVWSRWGINANIFNPSEKTITFMQDVLAEVIDLFPGTFIHVGGDEAIKDQWKTSQQVQARLKELNLKDEHELQSYFIRRMDTFLAAKGRRLIGWDEILEGGLAPGATVMSWRGVKGGITAAKSGHDVVMAPTTHTYLDYYQSQDPGELPAIGGFLPLETVYDFEPIPEELTAEEAKRVLGAQAQLWTEYLPTPGHVEYMAFPRLTALSEVTWSLKGRKNYADFLTRLNIHEERLQHLNVNFRPMKTSPKK
ncbi:MAG: beta-N-acetylhexosaminidase [Pyrinomonadaceae bacterium]